MTNDSETAEDGVSRSGGEDFTFYYGAASGGSQKALRVLGEPNVMLSYATRNNRPWTGIENLFVDCGAYSMLKAGKEHGPIEDYLTYLRQWQPEKFALRDYPCEPDLLDDLGRTVAEHQERTLEDHLEMVDQLDGVVGTPYVVLQGWETNDYLRCIEKFEDHGLPMENVAIGSVCRRGETENIMDVLSAIRWQLPDANIHAFGVKTTILRQDGVFDYIDSADSVAYDYRSMMNHHTGYWKYLAFEYLRMWIDVQNALEDREEEELVPAADGGNGRESNTEELSDGGEE